MREPGVMSVPGFGPEPVAVILEQALLQLSSLVVVLYIPGRSRGGLQRHAYRCSPELSELPSCLSRAPDTALRAFADLRIHRSVEGSREPGRDPRLPVRTRTEFSIPLVWAGQPLGVLVVLGKPEATPPSEGILQVHAMALASSLAALELRGVAERAQRVTEASLLLAEAPAELLPRLLGETARRLAGARFSAVGLGPEGDRAWSFSFEPHHGRGAECEGCAMPFPHRPGEHPAIENLLEAELRFGGRSVGHLYVANAAADGFTFEDRLSLQTFARHAAAVIAAQAAQPAPVMTQDELGTECERLRAVIARAPLGIVLVDGESEGEAEANTAAELILGRHGFRSEIGSKAAVLAADGSPLPAEADPVHRALGGVSTHRQEMLIRRPDGSEVPVLFSAVAIAAGGRARRAVAFLEDITPFKHMEALRREWTSVVAHDLRQCLQGINALTTVVARQSKQATDVTGTLSQIRQNVRHLDRMFGDLTDASLVEARRLKLERQQTNLGALVKTVSDRYVERLGDRLTVTMDEALPEVNLDPLRIEQVLMNLLSNAAKYGRPGGTVSVTVEKVGTAARVSVTNEGDGISSDDVHRLFARFQRARPANGAKGLGVGLYISRGLIEAHGGRIAVLSVPNETTTFFFTLPLGTT